MSESVELLTRDCKPNERFVIWDGPIVSSVADLMDAMDIITDAQFNHHVTASKNDFAQWVMHITKDDSIAKSMSSAKNRHELKAMIASMMHGADGGIGGSLAGSQNGAHALSDEEFESMKDSFVKRNETLDEKYYEISRRLKSVLDDPIPKDFEQMMEKLKSDYEELRVKISDARKQGKDLLIASLVMRQFTAKLKIAQATRDPDDIEKAQLVLRQAEFELSQAKEEKEINFKKEVYALAGLSDDGTPLEGAKDASDKNYK